MFVPTDFSSHGYKQCDRKQLDAVLQSAEQGTSAQRYSLTLQSRLFHGENREEDLTSSSQN